MFVEYNFTGYKKFTESNASGASKTVGGFPITTTYRPLNNKVITREPMNTNFVAINSLVAFTLMASSACVAVESNLGVGSFAIGFANPLEQYNANSKEHYVNAVVDSNTTHAKNNKTLPFALLDNENGSVMQTVSIPNKPIKLFHFIGSDLPVLQLHPIKKIDLSTVKKGYVAVNNAEDRKSVV